MSVPGEQGTGRRPTMKDVAMLARVSLSTVSRFVNGETARPELVARIQAAIDLLGYERDLTASTLRRADRASASIGVLVADVGNPFFAAVLRGIEEVARARGSVTVAASSDEDAARERELAAALIARRIDGLIVVPAADGSPPRGVPLAFVDRPPRALDADTVLSDNAGGTRAAIRHLIARGHSRIGFLGDHERIFTCAERLRGYREALAGAGARRPARPADRAVRQPEPAHHRRGARAAPARAAAPHRVRRLRRRTAGRRAGPERHRGRAAAGRARPPGRGAALRPHPGVRRTEPAGRRRRRADRARVERGVSPARGPIPASVRAAPPGRLGP